MWLLTGQLYNICITPVTSAGILPGTGVVLSAGGAPGGPGHGIITMVITPIGTRNIMLISGLLTVTAAPIIIIITTVMSEPGHLM
jgi:hypothetical protein